MAIDSEKPPVSIQPIIGEPWVKLGTGETLASWGRNEEIAYNQTNRQAEKVRFFRTTLDFLTDNRVNGDYLEFGCHRCRTFRMVLSEARRHNLSDMQFHAFDSFEGLPAPEHESAVEFWQRGALSTSQEDFLRMVQEHGIYVQNVHTIKGFYSESLTPALRGQYTSSGRKISLVNVDCDFYESALPVFDFIEPLLQEGSILYLDDLFAGYKGNPTRGVARAFLEYQKRSNWAFVRHLDVGWWGRSYISVPKSDGYEGVIAI